MSETDPLQGETVSGYSSIDVDADAAGTPKSMPKGGASVLASSFTLTNTMIGLGTVTMPFALAQAGFILGLGALFVVIAFLNFGYKNLVRASTKTGEYSFKGIAIQAFGTWGGVLSELIVVFYASCSCIAYVRVFGDYLPPLFRLALPSVPLLHNPNLCMLFSMIITFPMAGQETLDSLKHFSFMAIIGISLTVAVVVSEGIHRGVSPTVEWWGKPTFALAFPLFSVANTGHHNMLRIYEELENREDPRRSNAVINMSSLFCFVLYGSVGVAGYLALGESTPGNILTAYTGDERSTVFMVAVNLARLFLSVTIMMSFAMPHFAVREGIERVFFHQFAPSALRRWLLTFCLITAMLLIAMLVPTITWAFDISGSTFCALMTYVLPSIFLLLLVLPSPETMCEHLSVIRLAAYVTMIAGISFGAMTLIDLANGQGEQKMVA